MRIGVLHRRAVLAAALSLIAPAAFAQTDGGAAVPSIAETLSGEAKEDYESGKRLYENGDYAGALSKFREAARASSDPRLLWDAAACEQAMQHYASAITLVRRYLDSRSPLIGPEDTERASEFLRAAKERTAHLDVQSNATEAVVSVDGEPQGTVPLAADARIDLGTHRLTVDKEGFAQYGATLTVVSTADVQVTAMLSPLPPAQGRLVVRAGAKDTIAVDGALVGVGSWTGALPPGTHSLRVTEPESTPFESEVVIEADQTRALDVTLRRARRAGSIPFWLWIAGGTALAAGAATAAYLVFRPSETQVGAPVPGTIDTVPLRPR